MMRRPAGILGSAPATRGQHTHALEQDMPSTERTRGGGKPSCALAGFLVSGKWPVLGCGTKRQC